MDDIAWYKWLIALKHLAINEYDFTEVAAESMTTDESWKIYYYDGCTPREALEEDFGYV